MTVSLCLTVHNRPAAVSKQVADSFRLPGNLSAIDEIVLVLDRATPEAKEGARDAYGGLVASSMPGECPLRIVSIPGDPGWLCPARAWNHAFHAASGDLLYCISSEVVQDEGNVAKAAELAADGNTAVFGACHNSKPKDLVVGAEPGLLVSSKMARPLGFIVCMPKKNVIEIDGFDEEFMKGYWYDDDDLFIRLWNTGLDFLFTDDIHGVHLDHERHELESPEGNAGIHRNQAHMVAKHGTPHPWANLAKITDFGAGVTTWRHVR